MRYFCDMLFSFILKLIFDCVVILIFDLIVFIFTFSSMFVGIITENPHETQTRPLGQPRGLTACCIG